MITVTDPRKRRNPPELLAPAGSRECFFAAIGSGADAVYLGLAGFNARLRAKNFTARDLSTLVPYAHSRGVKVYAALNTLIKQSEIAPALNALYQLDQLGVDAVIMADIGLMRLSKDNFPNLRVHGSTQAAAHNSYGAEFLRALGVKRAVLARELSLGEIEETTSASPIETEVFIHGALCYSMSGMCLASSFIGGASGNRGRCAQVCRRRFTRGRIRDCVGVDGIGANSVGADGIDTGYVDTNSVDTGCIDTKCVGMDSVDAANDGYFFSPNDLQALPFINKLTEAGVASFKIEGRMKGAEYVGTVVKAYRYAIDHPEDVGGAEKMLRFDFGRAKTAFFMDGRRGEAIEPDRPSGTGIFLGTVVECKAESFTVSRINDSININAIGDINNNINGINTVAIEKNDRLRIHPQDGFEGTACRVASCQSLDSGDRRIRIIPTPAIECSVGDSVFLIGKVGINTGSGTDVNADVNTNINTNSINACTSNRNINIKPTYPPAKRITNSLTPSAPPSVDTNGSVNQNPSTKPVLWFKADNTEWLDIISATPCKHLIFDADIGEVESLINSPDTVKTWRSRISIALPPFIEEPKLTLWRGIVDRCRSVGLNSFTVSNVGHFPLVARQKNGSRNVEERIVADSLLWCLNRFTRAELGAHGVYRFVFSWEDEYLNIRDNTDNFVAPDAVSGIAQVYGRPPLFISRMTPAINAGEAVVDPRGGAFFVSTKNGLCYTLPVTPVCLFAKRKKLAECGVNDFLIDMSFHEPSYELMGALMSGYKQCVRIGGGAIFNFKAGLK